MRNEFSPSKNRPDATGEGEISSKSCKRLGFSLIIWGLLLTGCVCLSISEVQAHSGKARFHVVIDTDGAFDDLRSLSALLASTEVEVLAITTSEGSLTAQQGLYQVSSLLRAYYHEGIPVAAGRRISIEEPSWRSNNLSLDWGTGAPISENEKTTLTASNETTSILPKKPASSFSAPSPAARLIFSAIYNETEKVTLICLGPLTNVYDALRTNDTLSSKIERILWYNGTLDAGYNYECDTLAAQYVLKSGINIDVLSAGKEPLLVSDIQPKQAISYPSLYLKHLVYLHLQQPLKKTLDQGHAQVWDELVPVYLLSPELFERTPVSPSIRTVLPQNRSTILDKYLSIVNQETNNDSRVFGLFPYDSTLFAPDIRAKIAPIIAAHGFSEWRAGVITNELHGHVGIYAIVGVKMGLRAREYFSIGIDDVQVVSYAGSTPPISCMNDGLQVSTGGTLGHGLITLSDDPQKRPQALFTFKDKTIKLTLKSEYARRIAQDVQQAIAAHGNLTEAYWLHIRSLAIGYWLSFDRHEMFELEVVKP